jgi:hypothetical protein
MTLPREVTSDERAPYSLRLRRDGPQTTAARTGVDFGVFMAGILEYIPAGKSVKPEDIAVGGSRA